MRIKLKGLPCAMVLAGCYARQAAPEGAAPCFPEMALKEKLQRDSAARTTPLRLQRAVRQGEGAEFVVPAGVAYSDTGDLYISDNNAYTVHLWRSNSAAAGELTVATDAARPQ